MRRRYRGFVGQVAPLNSGLGWLPKTHATAEQNERFPDSLYFCGMEDYHDYVAKHGAVPAGSSILGTGMGMPQMCIDAGYRKEYVYGTGNILQTKITGPNGAEPEPAPAPIYAPPPPPPPAPETLPEAETGFPVMPPGTDPDKWAWDLYRTGYTDVDPRISPASQELETRQAAEGGDGIVQELEARAIEQTAVERVIRGGPTMVPDAPLAEKKPNWLPLVIAAATIYLMQ